MQKFKQLDYFRKVRQEVSLQQWPSSGLLSVCMIILLSIMIFVNAYSQLFPEKTRQAIIEQHLDFHGKMVINFNITLDNMPCAAVQLDMQDIMGSNIQDYEDTIYKTRINKIEIDQNLINKMSQPVRYRNNTECGDCYGAQIDPDQCCNTCEQLMNAYKRKNWQAPNTQDVLQCQHFAEFVDKNGEIYLNDEQLNNEHFQLIVPIERTGDLSSRSQITIAITFQNEQIDSHEEQVGALVILQFENAYNVTLSFVKLKPDQQIYQVKITSKDIQRKFQIVPKEMKLLDLIIKGDYVKDSFQTYSIYQDHAARLLHFAYFDDQFGQEKNQVTLLSGSDWMQMEQQLGEGCNIRGYIKVFKVPGNFHISMHGKGLVTFLFGGRSLADASHQIHTFYITDEENQNFIIPERMVQTFAKGQQMYQYYLKITKAINVNQIGEQHFYEIFSTFESQESGTPAIYFRYDIEPITMKYITQMDALDTFLISLCAIVGGTFAFASCISKVLFKMNQNI